MKDGINIWQTIYRINMIKTNKALSCLLVIMPLLFCGCQKELGETPTEHFLVSDTNDLVFEQGGGTKEISITAASSPNWNIENTQEGWVTAAKEGNKILVTVPENNQVEMRTTQLTVSLPGSKFGFSISQFGTEPTLIIKDGVSELKFNREKESKTIQIISNSSHWKVQPFGDIPWLKWEKNTEDNTLTLSVEDFRKDDPDSKRSRKGMIFISNGNQHAQVNILQKGWVQFADPIFMPPSKRSEIIKAEQERDNERNREYERRYYPEGEDKDKRVMAFKTDAEQTPLIIYGFDREIDPTYQEASGKVYLKAHEGKSFDEEDLKSWMEYNGYTESPKSDLYDQYQLRFYLVKDDITCYYDVRNSGTKTFLGPDYKGAYMEYRESSNDLSLTPDQKNLSSFPSRMAHKLHDPNFKIGDVIAYEKSQGLVPDYHHELTLKSSDPKIGYFSILFIPEKGNNDKKGSLTMAHYVFNCPEAMAHDPNLATLLSPEPRLEGTVGEIQYVYKDDDYVYNKRPVSPYYPNLGYDYVEKSSLKYQAELKGYVLGRSQGGFVTYYRGKDELVDVRPGAGGVVFQYYRKKEFVDNFTKKN